jgi:mannose-6-phosphate isomerase-like protein (cupin superfamily)
MLRRRGRIRVSGRLRIRNVPATPAPRGRAQDVMAGRPLPGQWALRCRALLHVTIRIMEAVNLDTMLARFAEHWSPKKIAQVNDYDVRIVKIQGEFTWHQHADTDEFFLVLDGQLTIQMRDRNVVLGPRELFVVPRGVEHCPRADAETAVLLFEPGTVINTGDAGGELTAEVEELV